MGHATWRPARPNEPHSGQGRLAWGEAEGETPGPPPEMNSPAGATARLKRTPKPAPASTPLTPTGRIRTPAAREGPLPQVPPSTTTPSSHPNPAAKWRKLSVCRVENHLDANHPRQPNKPNFVQITLNQWAPSPGPDPSSPKPPNPRSSAVSNPDHKTSKYLFTMKSMVYRPLWPRIPEKLAAPVYSVDEKTAEPGRRRGGPWRQGIKSLPAKLW